MMVLLIMVLHGLPVFLIGVWSDSKDALNIAAVISAILGLITGSPTWILADLFAIGLAYVAASNFISIDNSAREHRPMREDSNSSLEAEVRLKRQQELENREIHSTQKAPQKRFMNKFINFGIVLWLAIMLIGLVLG